LCSKFSFYDTSIALCISIGYDIIWPSLSDNTIKTSTSLKSYSKSTPSSVSILREIALLCWTQLSIKPIRIKKKLQMWYFKESTVYRIMGIVPVHCLVHSSSWLSLFLFTYSYFFFPISLYFFFTVSISSKFHLLSLSELTRDVSITGLVSPPLPLHRVSFINLRKNMLIRITSRKNVPCHADWGMYRKFFSKKIFQRVESLATQKVSKFSQYGSTFLILSRGKIGWKLGQRASRERPSSFMFMFYFLADISRQIAISHKNRTCHQLQS
jgi:hypothetical protein